MAAKKRVARRKGGPAPTEPETTEGGLVVREIPRSTLQGIETWEDAAKVWGDKVYDVREFGDGFKLLRKKQKETLVGVPFVIAAFKFNDGDYGTFATMHIVTKENQKFIVNDGSRGVKDQLTEFFKKTGQLGGLVCPGGLRVSDYEYEDEDGELKPARTYYLETSDVSA